MTVIQITTVAPSDMFKIVENQLLPKGMAIVFTKEAQQAFTRRFLFGMPIEPFEAKQAVIIANIESDAFPPAGP